MKHTVRAALAVGLLLGFYVVALGVVAVLFGAVYEVAVHGVQGALLLKLGLVALVIAFAIGKGLFTRTKESTTPGVPVTEAEQPRLWAEVRSLAEQVGTRAPDEIRLVPQVNAAVSEDARLLGLVPGTRRLYLGAPLLMGLTGLQLRSVLAHELGHYSGRHTALGGVTYRGKEAIARVLRELGPDSMVGRLLGLYGRLYYAVSHTVSRSQELEADAFSARIAGRAPAISALRELTPLDAAWNHFVQEYAGIGTAQGQRPADLFRGFADLLAAPAAQEQLRTIRDGAEEPPRSVYDSHPPTSERIASFERLPDDGVVDRTGPALDLLDDPDRALHALQEHLYEGADLAPVPWDQLVRDAGDVRVRTNAARLAEVAGAAGVAPVTVATLLERVREGRATELVAPYLQDADDAAVREATGGLLGDLMAARVLARGARFRPDWGRAWQLVDAHGTVLDPWAAAHRALADPAAVTEVEQWLTQRGVDLDETLPLPADEAGSFPSPKAPTGPVVHGAIAPVTGSKVRFLLVLDQGLLLKTPDTGDRVAAGTSGAGVGTPGEHMLRRVLARSVEDLLADPRSELIPWDRIESLHVEERRLRTTLVTVVLGGTDARKLKIDKQAVTAGEPWPAMQHHLGDRFKVATHVPG